MPDAPGVYFFLKRARALRAASGARLPGSREDVLYIGRATSLQSRVRSYFSGGARAARGPWIEKMLREATNVSWRQTDSVLEAILLESKLIKEYQPSYNAREKDDKSFNCVVITREDFPRVELARERDIERGEFREAGAWSRARRKQGITRKNPQPPLAVYGPFPFGLRLKDALKIIRRIFPFRDSQCIPPSGDAKRWRACFNREIGLCPGVCTGEVNKREYAKTVRNLRLFFEGKKALLIRILEREMRDAAEALAFEEAGALKRQIFALRHIQDVALLARAGAPRPAQGFRIEAYDLSHFGGSEIVGAMAVVEDGVPQPSEYRLFRLRGITRQHESAGLAEILKRRLAHPEWKMPQLVVVDGNEVQKRAAEAVLRAERNEIAVAAVVKDARHRPREILCHGPDTQYPNTRGRTRRAILPAGKELDSAILLGNSEAHRFVLRYQRSRRKLIA